MKRHSLLVVLIVLIILASVPGAAAQIGGGHTLFGDFKVDEGQSDSMKPQTFFVLLYTLSGHLVSRQTVSNNGRYRFNDVLNGEYDIVVEVESREVVRVRVVLMDRTKTDIRHDLHLEWREKPGSQGQGSVGTVSMSAYYTRQPENQARFVKALEALKKQDLKTAIALLRQILAVDSKDFVAWTELGTAQFKQGDTGEAEKSYGRAIDEKPSFALALLNLGKLQMAEKRFDGAIETLTRAVAAEPRSADAHYYLGESYLQIKKGSKAVAFLQEALRLDPIGKAEAHLRLAALYRGAGMKDKAVAEYKAFLNKRPDSPDRKQLEQYISENSKP